MYLECKPKDVKHMTGTQPERKMKNFVELIHLMTIICRRRDIPLLRQISTHPPSSKVGFFVLFCCFVHSGQVKTKKPTLLGGGCVEICLNEGMSPSPGKLLFDASAQSPPSDKTVEMLHFSYSRINDADFWTVVDIFDWVMRCKHKVYQNGLQDGDPKVPLCGFGGLKLCKCVCFFAWNLELILSSFEDRSSDSVLPCLLL